MQKADMNLICQSQTEVFFSNNNNKSLIELLCIQILLYVEGIQCAIKGKQWTDFIVLFLLHHSTVQ